MEYARAKYALTPPRTLDNPGAVCAFDSHGCSHAVNGRGGFDEHHRWPKSMHGPEHPDDLLVLCPSHHSRQHALLRYLVENVEPEWDVVKHFTSGERLMAQAAVAQWRAAGSPPIGGWSRPAAR